MSVKGWCLGFPHQHCVFQWTMRRRRRQQHCRCFHLQHLSPSTLRRRRRVSMWVLLRSWRHRDQTMTMTMNSVFYVSYQRRHRCVQPKKNIPLFCLWKKDIRSNRLCVSFDIGFKMTTYKVPGHWILRPSSAKEHETHGEPEKRGWHLVF